MRPGPWWVLVTVSKSWAGWPHLVSAEVRAYSFRDLMQSSHSREATEEKERGIFRYYPWGVPACQEGIDWGDEENGDLSFNKRVIRFLLYLTRLHLFVKLP